MKAVLISVSPYWYYLIAEGIKKVEVRKSLPQSEDWNKVAECYMSKDKTSFARIPKEFQEKYRANFGKVGMRFVCNRIDEWKYDKCDGVDIDNDTLLETMLDWEEINIYADGKTLYGWHISDLKIYDKPKELVEFRKPCDKNANCFYCKQAAFSGGNCTGKITRPPQSYMYVEEK